LLLEEILLAAQADSAYSTLFMQPGLSICHLSGMAKTCQCFKLTKKMIYDSPGGNIDQRFRSLPNYFGLC